MAGSNRTASSGCFPRGRFVPFFVIAVFLAYWVGRLHEDLISAGRRQRDQIAQITHFLDKNHGRYATLRFNRGPLDKFHLEGEVPTQEDLDTLRTELTRLFGEERAAFILAVSIVSKPDQVKPDAAQASDHALPE